jgi:hypothetical protein
MALGAPANRGLFGLKHDCYGSVLSTSSAPAYLAIYWKARQIISEEKVCYRTETD